MRLCSLTSFSVVNCVYVSAVVLYVGGRPVAETEHVGVYVVVLHPAGQAQDAHRRRAAAGQGSPKHIRNKTQIKCPSHSADHLSVF